MDRLLVSIHLRTERSPGEGVFGVALDFDHPVLLDLHEKTAGIRTIIGTDGSSDLSDQNSLPGYRMAG